MRTTQMKDTVLTADIFADIKAQLDKISPDGAHASSDLWRDRKSALMRVKILDATVQCLAQNGYSKTSTQNVATTANISRGTMLHHYATKAELITATIDYIYYKRLEAFHAEASKLTDDERVIDGQALEVYWLLVKSPAYDAYMELCMAARTDDELAQVLAERMSNSNAFFMNVIPSLFPEWGGSDLEAQQLALDLVVVALDGLRLNKSVIPDQARRAAVRKLVFETVQTLRQRPARQMDQ